MEQAQADAVRSEHLDQARFGLIQRPVGAEIASVLVAVGIAEHDFLHASARVQPEAIGVQRERFGHDVAAAAEVADGLEQRNDVEFEP